jgi:hypothetical protein
MKEGFAFRFYIPKRKSNAWAEVFLWDVHPTTFSRWNAGRWGYFLATWEGNAREGKFGELHFVQSRLREDLIVHELLHLWAEWIWANGETLTRRNEERLIVTFDKIFASFMRAYKNYANYANYSNSKKGRKK